MLKAIGSCLILFAGITWGFQMKQNLSNNLRHLINLQEMILMLSSEITYGRVPLKEAFLRISELQKEPFSSLLKDVVQDMETEKGQTLWEIWKCSIQKNKSRICFSKEEFLILEELGENLGCLDVVMQKNHMALYEQQIQLRIHRAEKELATKQKMYQYLGVLSGLFLILLLV